MAAGFVGQALVRAKHKTIALPKTHNLTLFIQLDLAKHPCPVIGFP